jgi:hypothetical protein
MFGVRQMILTEVFVLATLYKRPASTPAYDHAARRRLILCVAPSAVVLDVRRGT